MWSRRSGKSVGQHALLRLERDRHHARGERADGDEADLAEREHARVADEDVDRDDDRDRDERVQEVDLVRGRDGRRRRARPATTSSIGPSSWTSGVEPPPHTRSTAVRLPAREQARRAAAAGRGSRARRRPTAGRRSCRSAAAPLITPEAKPIAKPPSVAVQSRSMPPTTTPTSTMIVSCRAKSGVTNGCLHGQDHRDRGGQQRPRGRPRTRSRGSRARRAGARCGSRPPRRACAGRSSSGSSSSASSAERDDGDDDRDDRHLADVDAADRDRLVQRA